MSIDVDLLLNAPLYKISPQFLIKLYEKLIYTKNSKTRLPKIPNIENIIQERIKSAEQQMFLNLWFMHPDNTPNKIKLKIKDRLPYLYTILFPAILNSERWSHGEVKALTKSCIIAKINQNEEIKNGIISELTSLITSNEHSKEGVLRHIMSIVGTECVTPILTNILYEDKLGYYKNISLKTVCEYIPEQEMESFFVSDNYCHLKQFLDNKIKSNLTWSLNHLPPKTIDKALELCVEYLMANQKVNDQDNEISEYIGFLNHHPEYINCKNLKPLLNMEIKDELLKINLQILQIHINLECKNLDLSNIDTDDIEMVFNSKKSDIQEFNLKLKNLKLIAPTPEETNHETIEIFT